MAPTIFLTGATGFVGSTLLGDILRRDPDARVKMLVRAESSVRAFERVMAAVSVTAPDMDLSTLRDRCEFYVGDITHADLGLTQMDLQSLIAGVTHVIHCAASVGFQQSIDKARQTNVEGTRNVLAIGRKIDASGMLERFAYVGTAYIAGNRGGRIMEDDSQRPERFSNTYEQSKYEAEQLVREAMNEMPCTILRPSIIVGDSQSGRTLCFNVLYIPLKLISRGMIRNISGDPDTPLDVVPVDYVSQAIYELTCKCDDADGKTYHITMGDNATTIGEVVSTAMDFFRVRGILKGSISVGRFVSAITDRIAQTLSIFDVHLNTKRIFDNRRTRAALRGRVVDPLCYNRYSERLLDYCIRTNWGKVMGKAA